MQSGHMLKKAIFCLKSNATHAAFRVHSRLEKMMLSFVLHIHLSTEIALDASMRCCDMQGKSIRVIESFGAHITAVSHWRVLDVAVRLERLSVDK